MWFFFYFNFEKNYDVLKSMTPCLLLNKKLSFNKNENESEMQPFQIGERCASAYTKIANYRSSHQRCSMKKGVVRNFTKVPGKHLCRSLIFNKKRHRTATLLKKRLWHRCFPVNFLKFQGTHFFHLVAASGIKSKIVMNQSSRKKKVFFCNVYFFRRIFFEYLCFISVYRVLNKLSECTYFSMSKTVASYAFLFVFKIVKSLWRIRQFT